MGTTLTNGVYLPNEGERNCYAGLKTNWEILDQKVADVTALQQAVAGALHREIVESLPTTDINPNTIYMILSGTSATENVYNEFMYVNNAWELIGTSATDLTNYYTKSEVDGKLLLKANASDLTSHTGDTTIHVTTADKSTWNTVTSKANDSDVVHKSGDETIVGIKTFNDGARIYRSNSSENTPSIILRTSKVSRGSTTDGGDSQSIMFNDRGDSLLSTVRCTKVSNGTTQLRNVVNTTDMSDNIITCETQLNIAKNGDKSFVPSENSQVNLGSSSFGWKGVYAQSYYYGSNNVEFSTKFVTIDTDQTISGAKTFGSNTIIYNSDTTATTPSLILKNSKVAKGSTSETGSQILKFVDKNNSNLCELESIVTSIGACELRLRANTLDSNNQNVQTGVTLISSANGGKNFCPTSNNNVFLGASTLKWSRVYSTEYYYGSNNIEFSTKFVTIDTNQTISGNKTFSSINGVEPSSLSLPSDKSARIDISSYFTNTGTGDTNSYTVPANGYINLQLTDVVAVHCFSTTSNNLTNYCQTFSRASDGMVYVLFPVRKGDVFKTTWYTSTTVNVGGAFFIPCQGNV